jgi:hypothetical protein
MYKPIFPLLQESMTIQCMQKALVCLAKLEFCFQWEMWKRLHPVKYVTALCAVVYIYIYIYIYKFFFADGVQSYRDTERGSWKDLIQRILKLVINKLCDMMADWHLAFGVLLLLCNSRFYIWWCESAVL